MGVPVMKATRPDARAGAIWDRVIKSPSPLPAAKALSPSPYANPPLSARRARAGPARMAGEKPRAKAEEVKSSQAKAQMQEKEARQQKQAAQMRMVRGAKRNAIDGLADLPEDGREGGMPVGESEYVVEHDDVTVTGRPCTAADDHRAMAVVFDLADHLDHGL